MKRKPDNLWEVIIAAGARQLLVAGLYHAHSKKFKGWATTKAHYIPTAKDNIGIIRGVDKEGKLFVPALDTFDAAWLLELSRYTHVGPQDNQDAVEVPKVLYDIGGHAIFRNGHGRYADGPWYCTGQSSILLYDLPSRTIRQVGKIMRLDLQPPFEMRLPPVGFDVTTWYRSSETYYVLVFKEPNTVNPVLLEGLKWIPYEGSEAFATQFYDFKKEFVFEPKTDPPEVRELTPEVCTTALSKLDAMMAHCYPAKQTVGEAFEWMCLPTDYGRRDDFLAARERFNRRRASRRDAKPKTIRGVILALYQFLSQPQPL